ncbi:hypothetical protein [Maribacter sp. HTCC2170]|uniref:hypothetical protein n=1 Tax=Maribacter sp. (strain HTCC2170 / KCCM 42371) TaxID=313603 RepID=UPI00006AFDC9|nr:hypothetical protein [Maribacter sp. HTCC2170]EAR01238.1 hypothetical protein FB2170_10976 [Maribacter sp. HTCC2170]
MKTIAIRAVHHAAIKTQHVFTADNQVFLRKENDIQTQSDLHSEEWLPINFQWATISN